MRISISPSSGLSGSIIVPGDKSISHRVVMMSALADGVSRLQNWLPAGDCHATLNAMRTLGVHIDFTAKNETQADLVVRGVGLHGLKAPMHPLGCWGSGTTMRLLAGILAGQPFESTLDGHEGLRRRPMLRVATPLQKMGATVKTTEGRPPLTIKGGNLTGIDYTMPIASGQVKSAILLAGLFAAGETVVRQPGPARDHTENMLRAQGAPIVSTGNTIRLTPPTQALAPLDAAIPGDFSSAAFPLVAALLVPGSRVTIQGVNMNPTRTGLLEVLQAMQADVQILNETEEMGEPLADMVAQTGPLRSAMVKGNLVVRMIDEFPILAVAATQAAGTTTVRDAAELRLKETDRIKATVEELRKMGAHLIPHPDGFEVHGPTRLKGGVVQSHGDHRLAMALAVAGLLADGLTIVEDADVIADSYPGFVTMLSRLGAEVVLS